MLGLVSNHIGNEVDSAIATLSEFMKIVAVKNLISVVTLRSEDLVRILVDLRLVDCG